MDIHFIPVVDGPLWNTEMQVKVRNSYGQHFYTSVHTCTLIESKCRTVTGKNQNISTKLKVCVSEAFKTSKVKGSVFLILLQLK